MVPFQKLRIEDTTEDIRRDFLTKGGFQPWIHKLALVEEKIPISAYEYADAKALELRVKHDIFQMTMDHRAFNARASPE